MSISKLKRGIVWTGLIAGAATCAWMLHHQSLGRLNEDNRVIRQQLDQLYSSAKKSTRSQNLISKTNGLPGIPDDVLHELIRLRGEVSRLRREKLEAEQLYLDISKRVAVSNAPLRLTTHENIPRDSWNFAGYETPEAAFHSVMWARTTGKIGMYLGSLAPQAREKVELQLEGKPENEMTAYVGRGLESITGFSILSMKVVSDDEVVLDVDYAGERLRSKALMKRFEDHWKYAGGPPDE